MGKSGSRKKKSAGNQSQVSGEDISSSPPVANGGVNLDSSGYLKRAHELKEEGNRRFQAKDYLGALQQYENALRLTPKTSPDRAVFHSNRAACLMQMKPIDYDAVISECTLALQVQPRYTRALLRRARAYEAIGKYEMALLDVRELLVVDANSHDALEIAERLRMVSGPRTEAQQDLQSRPSPAALGASAVRGAPVSGLGPCLPSRPLSKKPSHSAAGPAPLPNNKPEKLYPIPPVENDGETKIQFPKVVLKPSNGSSRSNIDASKDNEKEQLLGRSNLLPLNKQSSHSTNRFRPLKLVYDHDIRLAQMPVNCSFKELRNVVGKRFPMSKAVLIKYKDNDGDLVTITCTSELKIAESCADDLILKEIDADKGESIGLLRLHIVEVSPEQEPPPLEEDEEKPLENEGDKRDDDVSQISLADHAAKIVDAEIDKPEKISQKEKSGALEDHDYKEVEIDDWLFEFAQLFRTHVGIDPDAHIDLHEIGMEQCSEALEETVTSEESQSLFDKAALKFQEVAALAFFNWGNVHMCAARKKMPIDDSSGKEIMATQLQTAYDWVREKYSLAKEKYEQALLSKPDFYEGVLALGQQQFEMAKLHWSFVLAKKDDLSKWDPTETISLFDSAEEKMKAATEMWEKLEEQRAKESKDPIVNKKDELLKRRKKQIHLFWGNMLFERSQVECKLGLSGWEKNLDLAVERFKLAGASEADILTVVKNHCSKEAAAEVPDSSASDSIL
ncbi:hypothetical protein F511_31933 [Dorcoceras hygrometricum]|uniref:PB1 domain-containing protein n=1 Tax=Dorcoceras hygrometricum TaxID=472368 RepID=A0A2Z7CLE4_9LAMI|nr:hypothetical protein F511_31933 [Dorcoceras hygrometricum]